MIRIAIIIGSTRPGRNGEAAEPKGYSHSIVGRREACVSKVSDDPLPSKSLDALVTTLGRAGSAIRLGHR